MYTKDKTVRLIFRVSESCYESITNNMRSMEMDNISQYLRTIVETYEKNSGNGLQAVDGPFSRGLIYLTKAQQDDLVSRMGETTFNHYCDRISSFMSSKGVTISDHYKRMIDWWESDLKRQTMNSNNAQKTRYGAFDPEEAFKNALDRTYKESIDK